MTKSSSCFGAVAFVIAGLAIALAPARADDSNVSLPRYPSVSPDGSQVVFSWRGDLWRVATAGGLAQRLTSHPADESYSAFSRDGTRLAFISTRSGSSNIHLPA